MRNLRVILAENDEQFRETRAAILRDAGFIVLCADSASEASRIAVEHYVNAAVLDVRLQDDLDREDLSGVHLARSPEFVRIPTIILTAHPDHKIAREILKLKSSNDFLDKAMPIDEFIVALKQAIRTHSGRLHDLEVDGGRATILSLVSEAGSGTEDDVLAERADELDDILGKLLVGYNRARIDKVLWRRHNRFCVSIRAWEGPELETQHIAIVRLQSKDSIDDHPISSSAQTQGAPIGTRKEGSAITLHYSAELLSLDGADDVDAMHSLAGYFRYGNPDRLLQKGLQNLCERPLLYLARTRQRFGTEADKVLWWRKRLGLDLERLSPDSVGELIRRAIIHLPILGCRAFTTEDGITFVTSRGVRLLRSPAIDIRRLLSTLDGESILWVLSPNEINLETILADDEGMVWLTDLSDLDFAPVEWTYSALEAAIRFDMIGSGKRTDISVLIDLEARLCTENPFGGLDQQDAEPIVRRIISGVRVIRDQAALAGSISALSYHTAMLAQAISRLLRLERADLSDRRELVTVIHAMISASYLTSTLNAIHAVEPDNRNQPLPLHMSIDNERQVARFNDREVRFGADTSAFRHLQYLYENRNRVVSRMDLYRYANGSEYVGEPNQVNTLNQSISRLRNLIEPDPTRPRYIQTVRGTGYMLLVQEY